MLHGVDQTVTCRGFVTDAKCILKQSELELGDILVSKEEIRYF